MCVRFTSFIIYTSSRGDRTRALISTFKTDQTDFTHWISFLPSKLAMEISPNLDVLSAKTEGLSSAWNNLSIIKQNGESQNGCFKKTEQKQNTPNILKNEHFLPSDTHTRKTNIFYSLIRTHTYVCVSERNKCSFFGKFGVLPF